jgi:hypothetical protein
MEKLFNLDTLLLFLGGLFSLFLTVVIIYSRQEFKRGQEKGRLEKEKKDNPESVGDIEQKLNDSYKFRKISFLEELTIYGLQPLFIISFVNLFNRPIMIMDVVITFVLIVFIIMHEFWAASRNSTKKWYQILIICSWITLFIFISIKSNQNGNNSIAFIDPQNQQELIKEVGQ